MALLDQQNKNRTKSQVKPNNSNTGTKQTHSTTLPNQIRKASLSLERHHHYYHQLVNNIQSVLDKIVNKERTNDSDYNSDIKAVLPSQLSGHLFFLLCSNPNLPLATGTLFCSL
ncbi:uncharacterized protein [Musca autumnalis]|uniref:uncharacterized protein n=1 Tax=Musca autumnalis TaxID=221902 RepID=UPI003CF6E75C